MKKYILLLICLFSGSVFAQNIPTYLPTNGLVGWWPFNGNANDESGNGNHGTVNGATLTSDRNGVQGKAYSFDGIVNNFIEIPSSSSINATNSNFSWSFWIKSNSISTQIGYNKNYGVISKTQTGTTCNGATIFEVNGFLGSQNLLCNPNVLNYGCGTNTSTFDNNWHHIVLTLKAGHTSMFYIDGKAQTSNSSIVASNYSISINSPIRIGRPTDSYWKSYNGLVDDIAIYNRSLTQQEITALYTGVVTKDIVASSGANGSISPSGTISVNSGSSQTYTFTPNPGYWIDSVIVNGVQMPTASSYTFNNVTSDQSIRVTYRSLAAALAAANICANDTLVSTVNLPALSNVRATTYYSNIYLFNQNNTSNAYKYNVNDRKYTAIANKPTACIECGVAEANGKVYCFNTNGSTQAYDIATNTWQVNATLPTAAGMNLGIYATSLNNLIYLTGGTFGLTQSSFYQYNPQTNAFTKLQDFSQPRVHTKLITYQNRIYAVGGEYFDGSNSIALSLFEVYNPSTNTWTVMPAMPEPLSSIGASIYNNKLYVFGGGIPYGKVSNKVYVFDFISNAWYLESNTLSVGRSNIEAKTANNMVFLFAGNDSTNHTSNQAIRYFCKDQLCTCKWAEYVCNGVSSDVPCPTSSLYRPGTVFCNGYATKVVELTNPITGKTWMDRNLGASQAATSSTDTLAYGDLYQWGRGADGHQCRNSATTNTLSTTDQPGHGNFIVSPNTPYDWRSSQNDSLWQGVNGINNPCPSGYRVPTLNELIAERDTWIQNSGMRAFKSILKFPMSGGRYANDGLLSNLGSDGFCWSSTGTRDYYGNILHNILYFNGGPDLIVMHYSAYGLSVRCIKD
jgi:N-acetylneuraminic acid mutarotase